jgi:hypothetical protein
VHAEDILLVCLEKAVRVPIDTVTFDAFVRDDVSILCTFITAIFGFATNMSDICLVEVASVRSHLMSRTTCPTMSQTLGEMHLARGEMHLARRLVLMMPLLQGLDLLQRVLHWLLQQ